MFYRSIYKLYCESPQSWSTLCEPMDCSAPWILCPWDFSRQEYWSGLPCPPAGVFPTQGSNPGIEPRSPTLRANSLPTEMPGKPKNTWLGSLSLLQGILPTQESNRGLLHCRWILYQLSYWRSPTNGTTLAWKDEYNFQKYLFIQEDLLPPLY